MSENHPHELKSQTDKLNFGLQFTLLIKSLKGGTKITITPLQSTQKIKICVWYQISEIKLIFHFFLFYFDGWKIDIDKDVNWTFVSLTWQRNLQPLNICIYFQLNRITC